MILVRQERKGEMVTKEEIISEIEKVPAERLEELYRVVKDFAEVAPSDAKHNALSKPEGVAADDPILQLGTEPVEDDGWFHLSRSGLAEAYGETEVEYSLDLIKEPNPDYEGR